MVTLPPAPLLSTVDFSSNAAVDSIYTERYMHTPQHNQQGYQNATISDAQALSKSVRFLLMHGVADDNVHMQNSLALLDKLDLASVENYDVHVFPDSDHSIYFRMLLSCFSTLSSL